MGGNAIDNGVPVRLVVAATPNILSAWARWPERAWAMPRRGAH